MIRDASALQVAKYIAPRMREWGRTDLHGLGIINHQRNVPPLDRSETPFRDDLITNAEQQGFGLMTAWDLYKLVRNFLKHDWKPDQVKPLFYRSGWIHPVPIHYTRIGTVEEFWDKITVVGIRLHDGQLSKGDRIAFTLPIEYEEQDTPEIQVDRQSVEVAQVGELVGVKTEMTKKQLRKGTVVYRAERRISACHPGFALT